MWHIECALATFLWILYATQADRGLVLKLFYLSTILFLIAIPANDLARPIPIAPMPPLPKGAMGVFLVPSPYLGLIVRYCGETGVPMDIACRIIWQESRWNPKAIGLNSSSRDEGLTQQNIRNHWWFVRLFNHGVDFDPFDPESSIKIGLRFLKWLWIKTGSWEKAIEAFNAPLGSLAGQRYAKVILGGELP